MNKHKTNLHSLVISILFILSVIFAISGAVSWLLNDPFKFKLFCAGLFFISSIVYLVIVVTSEIKTDHDLQSTSKISETKPHFSFPTIVDEYYLKYGYMDLFPVFPDAADIAAASEGKEIQFEEKEGVVFAVISRKIIGHISDGIIKDMILDYKKKKYPFLACIVGFQHNKVSAIYRIRFYVPLSKARSLVFPLVNLKRKTEDGDRPCDNLALCSEGDEVDIEIDADADKYRVYSGIGCEIGTLPPNFEDFYSEISYDTYARISDIEEGDDGAEKGSIEIFVLDKNKEISFVK